MCTRNELNLILQAMTQAYQAVYGANVVKIILYGSYARGDYQKDSDIDIVAIVQGDREKLQQGLKSVWDISSDLEFLLLNMRSIKMIYLIIEISKVRG